MGIVVIGDVFIDVKGYSTAPFIPGGRNAGEIQQIHGGVGRNVVEDIANIELKPTFVSLVDDDAMGEEVIRKLDRHKVDTRFMRKVPNGMGTWLAVFDQDGDVVASISKRPDHRPIEQILEECGDEIFQNADSVVIEIDIDKEIVKKTFHYAEKYGKKVYALVSNMTIAMERRDFLRKTACFISGRDHFSMFGGEKGSYQVGLKLFGVIKLKDIQVDVVDTTGAGDAFFAGVCVGLTYGKTLREACAIGTRLSSTVICTSDNICPRFMPEEFGLDR